MTKDEYFDLAMAKVKENDHEKAIELFSLVLKEDPENANALSHRGIAFMNLEQFELALKDMNEAIKFDPEYSFRYQCRAYLKARMNDHEAAVKDYEKAVELDPNDTIAYNNLALAQEQLGWHKQAKANFDKSDKMQGIKTLEERAKERVEKSEVEMQSEDISLEKEVNKGEIAKSVFTKKSSFKEFIRFIGNGFKLKEDDKS